MADHPMKKPDPLLHLPVIEKIEEVIKSEFYELRQGKIWFSEEIKREHRRLKTSLVPLRPAFPIPRDCHSAVYLRLYYSVRAA